MVLSETYILNGLYTYAGSPTFNKYDGTYNCGCPICKEGKSWGRKKRLYYYPQTKTFYCFNCNESWTAVYWIHLVSGLSYDEIRDQNNISDFSVDVSKKMDISIFKPKISSLPIDSINIFDQTQSKFYKHNKWFLSVTDYIKKRKLDSAVNKSKTYYISFTDTIHKNRLVLPFMDNSQKIVYYQTRSLDGSTPKYLGKYGSDKTVFGIDRIDSDFEYIFIFEGPIDSMFVKNGVAVAGLTLTNTQKAQLSVYPFHHKIWVLDNISVSKDEETKNKLLKLIDNSEKVYKWSNNYKDLNEWCVDQNINGIDPNIIINNLY